jgi:hypothetical protein
MMLSGHWREITVLSMRALAEYTADDTKHALYEKLECVFNDSPTYRMQMFVRILHYYSREKRYFLNEQLRKRICMELPILMEVG